jgi:hypothetical protein
MASEQVKALMRKKGLQFPVPEGRLTVIMEDEIMHTVDFPVCDDPTCICYACERQTIIEETTPKKRQRRKILVNKAMQSPLNGNRGFNLMR